MRYCKNNLKKMINKLPLKYNLQVLDENRNIVDSTVDIQETIVKLQATLYFNIDILKGWMPTLAYSSETTSSSGAEDETQEKIYVGIFPHL